MYIAKLKIILIAIFMIVITINGREIKEGSYSKRSAFYIAHGQFIESLLLSKDEKYLFVSNPSDIMMWDIEKRVLVKHFKGHSSSVLNMVLSDNGKYLFSASGDKTIIMWDIKKGSIVKRFKGHKTGVYFMGLSQNEKEIVSASKGGIVKVWSVATAKVKKEFRVHTRGFSFALSHNKQYFLSGASSGELSLWDIKSGKRIKSYEMEGKFISDVAFSSDDKKIVAISSDTNRMIMFDRDSGETLWNSYLSDFTKRVTISSDDKYIAVALVNGAVGIVDFASGNPIKKIRGRGGNIRTVLFNADSSKLFYGSWELIVNIWDMKKGQELPSLNGYSYPDICDIFLIQNDKKIVSVHDDNSICFWSRKSGELLNRIEDSYASFGTVSIGESGRYMLVEQYGDMHLWNIPKSKKMKIFRKKSTSIDSMNSVKKAMRFCMGGDAMAVGSGSGTITIWNLDTKKRLKRFKGHKSTIVSILFSQDEKYMLSTSRKHIAKLWDVQSEKELQSFEIDSTINIVFSGNGKKVAWALHPNKIAVYDIEKSKIVHILKGHHFAVSSLKISRDGRYLVSNSTEGYIKLWNLKTGKESQSFRKQYGRLIAFSISKNSKYVLLGLISGNVRVWDIAKAKERKVFHGNQGIGKVLISDDERYALATTKFGGSLKIFDIVKKREVKEFIFGKSSAWVMFDKVKKRFKYGGDTSFIFRQKRDGSLK